MEKYTIIENFKGYRNLEDITKLGDGYLVKGSKNVLIGDDGRIKTSGGFEIDGQTNTSIYPILASFDWQTHFGAERNLRAYNTSLQVRYVPTASEYYGGVAMTDTKWIDLMTITSPAINFVDYWNTTTLQSLLLFVNGASAINEWTGGITTFSSATTNTITKQGTTTWDKEGFYTTGTHKVIINGVEYTATGGWGTTTLTGVTPDPTSVSITVGELCIQSVETTLNSAMTDIPSDLKNDIIDIYQGQVYIGSYNVRSVYVSNVNNYKDYSFSISGRLVGEGQIGHFDGNVNGFISQEDAIYISTTSGWHKSLFILSGDNVYEALRFPKINYSLGLNAKSQSLIGKIKDSVVFVSDEPSLEELGRVESKDITPLFTNLSDPIEKHFDEYDFTDGSIIYHKRFIYIAVPKESVVLVYNLEKKWWEAPQTSLAVSRFSIIDGELYGHSYANPETYKLLIGYNANGKSIESKAVFSYQNYDLRANKKKMTEYYLEGYISSNTELTYSLRNEIDGCKTDISNILKGTDDKVCVLPNTASLGKESLGKNPLGGTLETSDLPPKFRIIKDLDTDDFYEHQFSFSSVGIDQHWELLAFGGNVKNSDVNNLDIKV